MAGRLAESSLHTNYLFPPTETWTNQNMPREMRVFTLPNVGKKWERSASQGGGSHFTFQLWQCGQLAGFSLRASCLFPPTVLCAHDLTTMRSALFWANSWRSAYVKGSKDKTYIFECKNGYSNCRSARPLMYIWWKPRQDFKGPI
jgi:hypothetical protein